ncbi:Dimethyladenosine transferase 1, mitochondrial [Cichlidogyrus casuarinus]|uniref:rRNA adenine N(6)-methyltransferase n=1 Tax=Cichlidogyrus casuarinus TaxID=1844966 RepID=A0ABD2QAL8_9PLAT
MKLDNDAFLVQLGKMFTKTRTSGSVFINMKRYDGRTKPIPRNLPKNTTVSKNYSCLIRASNSKTKISTVVSSENMDTFSSSYSNVLKINIDGLKKRDRKQAKSSGDMKRSLHAKRPLNNFISSFPEMKIPALPSIREILQIYGIKALKHLGQNFLLQPRCIDNIVKCAGDLRDAYVIEVGPGPGGLTRSILRLGPPKYLAVVELDRRFLPGLEELRISAHQFGTKMDIYRTDILQFPMDNLFPDDYIRDWSDHWSHEAVKKSILPKPSKMIVIGNLPFNISTPLISNWINDIAERRGLWRYGRVPMLLTFQKEVAERLIANPWEEQRSRLSIMAQNYCNVEYKRTISGKAFSPKAKVDVGVVKLTPYEKPIISTPYPYLHKLVKHAFIYRQKRIVRCMETLFPPQRPDLLIRLFKEAAVQPSKASFELNMLEFRDLVSTFKVLCDENPNLLDYAYTSKENLQSWHRRRTIQRDILGVPLSLNNALESAN